MTNKTIIAIDGPSGVGKGVLGRNISKTYGFAYLDTGSLYRAITLHLIRQGFDMDKMDEKTAAAEAEKTLKDNSILEYAKSPDIRSVLVDEFVFRIASFEKLREAIRQYQKDFGYHPPPLEDGSRAKGAVVEGRDIGTVIFPDAPLKIYLTASAEEKAKRRFKQYADEGIKADYDEILSNQLRRDNSDSVRMKIAPDAVIVDNSNMDKEQTFKQVQMIIKEKLGL